jgi:hypothetical protein
MGKAFNKFISLFPMNVRRGIKLKKEATKRGGKIIISTYDALPFLLGSGFS